MKITPLEIRQHAFEKIFRGYNIDEVDTFLANLSQEWERVLNESKMLRMQLEIAEKEASKLREIEMTLFKTLKTAEDTSNMITEQASQQAEKHVQDAHLKGEDVINEAKARAATIVADAEAKAKYIKEEVLGEVKGLERDFRAMDHYKDNLLVQMKSLANATIDHVERFESKFDKEGIDEKFKEATAMIEQDLPTPKTVESIAPFEVPIVPVEVPVIPVEEPVAHIEEPVAHIEEPVAHIEEPVAHIEEPVAHIEEPVVHVEEPVVHVEEPVVHVEEPVAHVEEPVVHIEEPVVHVEEPVVHVEEPIVHVEEPVVHVEEPIHVSDDLKIIEGVGPKIADVLNNAGIHTFKDLATTPSYKVKDILEAAGARFASHDPSTWGEQAKLAAEGKWDALKTLQDRLLGGRPEHENAETTPAAKPKVENKEQITEEMLEKVNKVKAAIRKAMTDKAESSSKDNSPLPTVNDVMAKNEGGSFFDNF